jgi:hypothetical protein
MDESLKSCQNASFFEKSSHACFEKGTDDQQSQFRGDEPQPVEHFEKPTKILWRIFLTEKVEIWLTGAGFGKQLHARRLMVELQVNVISVGWSSLTLAEI